MKKTKKLINKLLEELERTPLVQTACEKLGISRNTFYRWMKEDEKFLEKVTNALSLGNGLVNDVAVSNILAGIKAKDFKSTVYWLNRKHPDFKQPYRERIDADDILEYSRILRDGARRLRTEEEIKASAGRWTKEQIADAEKRASDWLAKWKGVEDRARQKEAQKLFEKWKKEFLDSKGYEDDPTIT